MPQPPASPSDATTVVGIDLAAGRGITALATLTVLRGARPRLVEVPCALTTDDAILTYLYEQMPAIVAVDAPLSLPAAAAAALAGTPDEDALTSSPYTRAAERDPLWSRIGVRPLPVSFLGGLTLRALVLAARMRVRLPTTRVVETFPSAVLRVLDIRDTLDASGGAWPSDAESSTRRRQAKTALPVRRATQRGLARWIDGLPLPLTEEAVLGADALDALAAALAGVALSLDAVCRAGTPEEGQILIPDADALARALRV